MPFYARFTALGPPLEIWLNGISLAYFPDCDGQRLTTVIPLDEAVLPGENELIVVLDPGPTPWSTNQSHPPASGRRSGALKVMQPPSWQFDPDTEPALGQIEWDEPSPRHAPEVLSLRFSAPLTRSQPRWWSARPTPPDAALTALIERAQDALDRGDVAALMALRRPAIFESTRHWASEAETSKFLGETEAFLTAMLADTPADTARGAPPPVSEWEIRPLAGGRLLELVARDRQPIVRRGPPENRLVVVLRAGFLDGRWHILL